MVKETVSVQLLKLISRAALVGAVALGVAACAPLQIPAGGGDQNAEMNRTIVNGLDKLEADHRQMKSDLGNINSAVDANSEKLRNQLDDMNAQLKQQQKQLDEIRSMLAAHPASTPSPGSTFPQTNPGPGTPEAAPGPATNPAPGQPGPAPASFPEALNRGKQLYDQGQYDAAREAFNTALKLATAPVQQIEANYRLGETAFAQKDYAAARNYYTAAIQIDEHSETAWLSYERLADIDWMTGNTQAALKEYNDIMTARGNQYPRADRVRAKIAQIQSGAPAPAPGS